MADTNVKDQETTEAAPAEAPAQTATAAPAQPVTGALDPSFVVLQGATLVSELPSPEEVQEDPHRFLLPGAADTSHSMSGAQLAVILNYIAQEEYPLGDKFEVVVADLRTKAVKGRQKDWNIVGWIAERSRAVNADELMTADQMKLIYDSIVPALSGRAVHWDPGIQARIQQLSQSNRDELLKLTIRAETRGHVSLFMRKFDAFCGRPPRQSQNSENQAATTAEVLKNAGVPAGQKGDGTF